MSLAHARSLLRGVSVSVRPHTPDEDAKKLTILARWALRFSPVVAPDPPDGLLIDIHGCEHLYGGEIQLVATVTSSLERLGFPVRMAVAPTFAGAWAIARFGKSAITFVPTDAVCHALKPLPLAALRIGSATRSTLAEMGVETVDQLLELPRNDLAARFGRELLIAIDKALGRVPETIEPIRISTPPEVSHLFDGPVANFDVIVAVIEKRLGELVDILKKRQLGVCLLRVELHPMKGDPVIVSLEFSHPSNDLSHLWTLLRLRLERVRLHYGVEEIILRAPHTRLITQNQSTLWHDDFQSKSSLYSESFGRVCDQLTSHLGPVVTQAVATQSYVPEKTFYRITPTETKKPNELYPSCRPSCLYETPEPIDVTALFPDGPLAWLKWQGVAVEIIASFGPERISPPWWNGDLPPTRDYFMVQDELGRWLWVFREQESRRWFVHGEWA